MFDSRWDAGLDDAQLAAVMHGDAPLIVLAGAGTGKTRTLVSRVASLLERGVPGDRILLLTFTRRAAEEMLARAGAICGRQDTTGPWGGTFHATAYRLVAAHAEALGLSPQLSVLDPGDARDLMDLLRSEHGLTGTSERFPRADALLDIYSRSVNTHRPAREIVAEQFPWCEPQLAAILELFRAYVTRKRGQSLLDFDDLLLSWRALLADPTVGPLLAQRWDHVLVDEYQDVNQVQVDIVNLLRPDGQGLTVVGDDAQAVYGFRGADSRHLLDLAATLPGARTVRLERNFRSRQRLLDLANAVRPGVDEHRLALHSDRTGGRRPRLMRCHDASGEARLVVDAVLEAAEQGRRLRDQAVLMRAAHHSDLLEVELTARGVPFVKFGGLKFLEAAHVKDFVATVRLLDNRLDELAWFRLLRLHEGIGPARAQNLLAVLDPAAAEADSPQRHAEVVAAAPAMARTALARTLDALAGVRALTVVSERAAAVLELLRPLMAARYADHPVRLTDLERLVSAAGQSPTLADYIATLTLDPPVSTSDVAGPPHSDDDYLVLSTVHSAKGLEWDSVHVIHVVDGAFPSDMALSTPTGLVEEQRLFYVAATRARDELAIYTPLRMPHHRRARDDRHSFAPASRFLDEAALAAVDVHEQPRPQPVLAGPVAAARVAIPSMDELWA